MEHADDINDPSEHENPAVITRKKDPSKCRITVDLRALNRNTIRPTFPSTPAIKVISQIPGSARFFTVLDGLKGFPQVVLHEESRKLTTFVLLQGRFRYKRMPMGWHGSSDVFNARMTKALEGVPNIKRVVEDILVYSDTIEEHHKAVTKVLAACNKHSISINPDKIEYCKPMVKFA